MNYKLIVNFTLILFVVALGLHCMGVTADLSQAIAGSVESNSDPTEPQSSEKTGNQESVSLLQRSVYRLKNWQPLEAGVRHKIEMFDKQLTGPGRYLQAGEGSSKAKLEITFQSGDFQSDLTQINDGRFLYIRNDSDSLNPMQRIDLAKIGEKNEGENSENSDVTADWKAMGGLAYLIEKLEKEFEFTKPLVSELGGIEVYVLEGTWKPEKISTICGNLTVVDKEGKLIYENLPPQLPSHVRIALGKNDPLGLFPHQIVYFRREDVAKSHSRLRPIATFEFHDVKPATELEATTFQIKEDNTRLTDITNSIIKMPEKQLR